MSLKFSYTLFAPFYDAMVGRATRTMRQDSLAQLGDVTAQHILLAGVGTGLDLPYLPKGASYVGVDITPAMLQRAQHQCPPDLHMEFHCADVQHLPFAANTFDQVILHLILAVVPQPIATLQEAARVLKPGGSIIIMDKFLRRGQTALLRRLINPILRHFATSTTVVFEDVLAHCPSLHVHSDVPALADGWFRRIVLRKEK